MDHLPGIKIAESQFPKIPYLCNEEYDGLFWEEYPTRRGWDLKRLIARDFIEHPMRETASFLQNWLFFGTIDHILGLGGPINRNEFLTEDEGGTLWITTARLDDYVRQWAESMNGLENDMESLKSFTSKMHRCLNDVAIFSDILYKSDPCPLPAEVIVSFKILGCTIESALTWCWNVKTPRKWELRDIAVSRMLQTGWCLRDVSMANHYLSEITMFYASYTKRDYRHQDHSECTDRICAVNQVDEASYRTQHTTTDCQCHHVAPDQEEIRKILKKGQVPVISLTSRTAYDGSQTLEVGVKAHAYSRWFVAISHVWSDGLGNPNQNSLPLCQVQQLYRLIVDVPWGELFSSLDEGVQDDLFDEPFSGDKWTERMDRLGKTVVPATRNLINKVRDRRGRPISIWIDTFCVPLEKEYRKMAISGLVNVYSGAMFTIVLDSELQRTSSLCSDQEILLRIATSGWMRRAWTFQEGVLANARLRVRFADSLVDLPKLVGPETSSPLNGVDFYITHNAKIVSVLDGWGKRVKKLNIEMDAMKLAEKEAERKKNFTISAYIAQDARTFFNEMQKVWYIEPSLSEKEDKLERIIAAWNGLQWRATSRENDKFIIFATACFMGPKDLELLKPLINSPADQRIKTWISQQACLPEGVLFTKGPRLMEPGWRWAPSSIHQDTIIYTTCVDRAPGDRSLRVIKPGFLIFAGGALTGCKAFGFKERQSSQRYRVRLDTEYLPSGAGLIADGTLGLILGKSGFDIDIGSGASSKWNEEVGALIKISNHSSPIIVGSFVCTVEVRMEDSDASEEVPGMVLARSVKTDQVWNVT